MQDPENPPKPDREPLWDGYPPNPHRDGYFWIEASGYARVMHWSSRLRCWRRFGRRPVAPLRVAESDWKLLGECVIQAAPAETEEHAG